MDGIGSTLTRGTGRIVRAMIWVPAGVDAVRQALHAAGLGPAALLSVDSGTVVVVTGVKKVSDTGKWADVGRAVGGFAVVFAWGYRGNSYPAKVSGATAITLAAQLATVFALSEDEVRPFLRTDSDNAAGLLELVGKPDAARVARHLGTEAFDTWLAARVPRSRGMWAIGVAALLWVGLAITSVFLKWPMGVLMLATVVLGGFALWWPRRVITGGSIDQVLPVVCLGEMEAG